MAKTNLYGKNSNLDLRSMIYDTDYTGDWK